MRVPFLRCHRYHDILLVSPTAAFKTTRTVYGRQCLASKPVHSRSMASSSSEVAYRPTIAKLAEPSSMPEEFKAKPHHNDPKDISKGFNNPWPSYRDFNGPEIMFKMIRRRLNGQSKAPDTKPPTVPVRTPTFLPTRTTPRLRATWLGHACFYAEFPTGLRVLFDPVFTPRCSPFSFMGPKRYTEVPCDVTNLPFVDAVMISHNHYDHLSHPTIMKIATRYPKARFFVPLGNKAWFEKCGIASERVVELDWWEERELKLEAEADEGAEFEKSKSSIMATIGCLPCQHTSARTGWDKGKTLWSSWSVVSGGKKLYFAGDTGYRQIPDDLPAEVFDYGDDFSHLPHNPAFRQIGDLRGPFHLGLIPIGAYSPRFIMSPMHANPYDSVNIFEDTKCESALGMHWGTWVLTDEDVMEPPRKLKDALKWRGVEDGEQRFTVCDIGESREY